MLWGGRPGRLVGGVCRRQRPRLLLCQQRSERPKHALPQLQRPYASLPGRLLPETQDQDTGQHHYHHGRWHRHRFH